MRKVLRLALFLLLAAGPLPADRPAGYVADLWIYALPADDPLFKAETPAWKEAGAEWNLLTRARLRLSAGQPYRYRSGRTLLQAADWSAREVALPDGTKHRQTLPGKLQEVELGSRLDIHLQEPAGGPFAVRLNWLERELVEWSESGKKGGKTPVCTTRKQAFEIRARRGASTLLFFDEKADPVQDPAEAKPRLLMRLRLR